MTTTQTRPAPPKAKARPPRSARVAGYLIAAAINAGILWLVIVAPGWRWLPFLTEDFSRVLGLVTLSLVLGVVVNVVYVAVDPIWMKRLGDALTTAVGAVVMLQLLTVFPFDLGSQWGWLHTPLRILLVLGCAGAAIGVLVNLAQLVGALATGQRDER
jgi:hypothetical protein